MAQRTLTYFGVLRSISSWAKVARELLRALANCGLEFNIFERKGFLFDPNFSLDPVIESKIANSFLGDFVLTFEHPAAYQYLPKETFNIGLLVYEFTALPDFWVGQINRHLDLVLVPSEFCRRVFIDSGVDGAKLRLLRYGFNPDHYYPADGRPINARPFTFLCLANPHKREGVQCLLEAFSRAFGPTDRAKLLLKLTYLPSGKIKNFEYADLPGLLQPFSEQTEAGRLEIMTAALSEREMGNLYRGADCYASLSCCEAFGLCFLEALACGLPVIAPGWSGQMDYLSHANSLLVPVEMVKADGEEYEPGGKIQQIARPDVAAAAEIMRQIYSQKKAAPAGASLLPSAQHWWWKSVAADFMQILHDS